MRYFYYGPEWELKDQGLENRSAGEGKSGHSSKWDEALVIEDDTIYEIDPECEACREKIEKHFG